MSIATRMTLKNQSDKAILLSGKGETIIFPEKETGVCEVPYRFGKISAGIPEESVKTLFIQIIQKTGTRKLLASFASNMVCWKTTNDKVIQQLVFFTHLVTIPVRAHFLHFDFSTTDNKIHGSACMSCLRSICSG